MRIGVLSDTHCKSISDLPPIVLEKLAGVSAIIHAGDAEYCSFLKELAGIAPVHSVKGNNDKDWKSFPLEDAIVLSVEGFDIGVSHGHLGHGKNTVERVSSIFNGVDLIIYGHNHREAGLRRRNGFLMLNPGSPTDTRQKYCSMAILDVNKTIEVNMVQWRSNGNESRTARKYQATTTPEKTKQEKPKSRDRVQGNPGKRNGKGARGWKR